MNKSGSDELSQGAGMGATDASQLL